MGRKAQKPDKSSRPPRIRVPNGERALFTVDAARFVGVIQQLSLTGGSTVLPKGPVPHGTVADMSLKTVFGRVDAKIEFLHTGADGFSEGWMRRSNFFTPGPMATRAPRHFASSS
jgi:hypothetical protein